MLWFLSHMKKILHQNLRCATLWSVSLYSHQYWWSWAGLACYQAKVAMSRADVAKTTFAGLRAVTLVAGVVTQLDSAALAQLRHSAFLAASAPPQLGQAQPAQAWTQSRARAEHRPLWSLFSTRKYLQLREYFAKMCVEAPYKLWQNCSHVWVLLWWRWWQ